MGIRHPSSPVTPKGTFLGRERPHPLLHIEKLGVPQVPIQGSFHYSSLINLTSKDAFDTEELKGLVKIGMFIFS